MEPPMNADKSGMVGGFGIDRAFPIQTELAFALGSIGVHRRPSAVPMLLGFRRGSIGGCIALPDPGSSPEGRVEGTKRPEMGSLL
jgi:hypothetical protein